MEIFGNRGTTHNWFNSYLRNRKHYTVLHKALSSYANVNIGVPQGSILCPIQFILNINYITQCSNKSIFLLYADNATIFVKGDDISELETTVRPELEHLSGWIKSNRVHVHTDKTHCMTSHSMMTRALHLNIEIKINQYGRLGK